MWRGGLAFLRRKTQPDLDTQGAWRAQVAGAHPVGCLTRPGLSQMKEVGRVLGGVLVANVPRYATTYSADQQVFPLFFMTLRPRFEQYKSL